MQHPVVVITGSTKGIGFGLAAAFLQRGCRVVISGRDTQRLEQALKTLSAAHPAGELLGQGCDVREPNQIQALWDAAVRQFGQVDFWINNAALGSLEPDFWEHDTETIAAVVQTNLLGTMYGARVAARAMIQQGHGQIFVLEGWGSSNEMRPGSTLYGTTKAAIRYFARSMAKELKKTPVLLGRLNPGVVPTDLLALSIPDEGAGPIKFFINAVGDRVETLAPALAEQVLANRRNNRRIRWMPTWRMLGRLILAPFRHRHII